MHDLLLRLYTSPSAHRLLPAAVAMPLIAAIEAPLRRHRHPADYAEIERLMGDLLQYTPRADDARDAARSYQREQSRLRELFWRPWLLKRSRVHGRQHWETAHAGGRGCIMVLGHFAGSWAVSGILGTQGFDVRMVASAHFWDEPDAGLKGKIQQHLREEYGERALGSERLIPNSTPPEEIVRLLEDGKTLGIAFDVPGSAATPFLGRSVSLTSGPATLSFRTGATVLPVITERHGTRMDLRILTPLDPAEFRDVRSLRAAIARTYEPFVIDKPEIVEVPWSPSPLITETLAPHAPYVPGAPRL